MDTIKVEHNPSEERLNDLGVRDWPLWAKEASEFPWSYDEKETCYILEGEIEVTPDGGAPVQMGAGDLVTFPQGLSCTWNIRKEVRKRYRFG